MLSDARHGSIFQREVKNGLWCGQYKGHGDAERLAVETSPLRLTQSSQAHIRLASGPVDMQQSS